MSTVLLEVFVEAADEAIVEAGRSNCSCQVRLLLVLVLLDDDNSLKKEML